MSNFHRFQEAVDRHITMLQEKYPLFRVKTTDNNEVYDTYLASFTYGTNPVFREKTEHDCSCCKQFIRAVGDVVAVVDNKLVSIWNVEVEAPYQVVADALSAKLERRKIKEPFYHWSKTAGAKSTVEVTPDKTITWNHFHTSVIEKYVNTDPGTDISDTKASVQVFRRSLREISLDVISTVVELIEQNSIYRGAEHLPALKAFKELRTTWGGLSVNSQGTDIFYWLNANKPGARIRNTAIGTLLLDLADGKELDTAVSSFESKVAPSNYKRPKALATPRMIEAAKKELTALGYVDALPRRHATLEDISINDVLFADRSAKAAIDPFGVITAKVPTNKKALGKVEEVPISVFLSDILPKAESLEVLVENRQVGNFVTLIAPVNGEALNMLQWGNNFSWSYKGNVTDSMKERVKAAGGRVDGVMRFSIQWNNNGDNNIDFDAWCIEPDRNKISYNRKHSSSSCGQLDVDVISPGKDIAVENITWGDKQNIQQGVHRFSLHNYSSSTSNGGFTAEVEVDGVISSYTYEKNLRGEENVPVAEVCFKDQTFKVTDLLSSKSSPKNVWSTNTENFHKVSVVMNSPNYWDGEKTGNKHIFFMLEGCANTEDTRGLYNEFLNTKLTKHRKTFEMLGASMKVPTAEDQLSGLGFSLTQSNHLYCKVSGSFSRTIKIIF